MSAVVALDEIPAGVGGFTVLPGSHVPVYYSMEHEYHCAPPPHPPHLRQFERCVLRVDEPTKEHWPLMEKLIAEETPHETTAHRGDCVFYHHRIVHSAGVNRTGFGPNPWIRKAALCDYMRADRPMKSDMPLEMSSYRKVAERAAAGNHPPLPSFTPRASARFCFGLTARPWSCVSVHLPSSVESQLLCVSTDRATMYGLQGRRARRTLGSCG